MELNKVKGKKKSLKWIVVSTPVNTQNKNMELLVFAHSKDCKNREVLILKLAPSKLELILNKYKVINITS